MTTTDSKGMSDYDLSKLVTHKIMPERAPIAPFATDSGLALEAALKEGTSIEIAPQMGGGFRVWGYLLTERGVYGTTVARALCFAALRAAGQKVEDDS